MASKQVGIALHKHFYIRFFQKYNNLLLELIKVNIIRSTETIKLKEGISKIYVMYSAYSYYLKEHDGDEYLKLKHLENEEHVLNDKRYNDLLSKSWINFSNLNFNELCELNKLHNKHLNNTLEIFGSFCKGFASSDLFPKLTSNVREHEKEVIYAVYDVFYETFYLLHAEVQKALDNFNIMNLNKTYSLITVFFYGYYYYLQNNTIKLIKDELRSLNDFYNNVEFQIAYYNVMQGVVDRDKINIIRSYNKNIFEKFIHINELINNDLPKTNMFPKRNERIVVDETLI